jgi:2-hydroxy-3-oxopropionate reductase
MEATMDTVGLIGLGPMGLPMALALQEAGFRVTATSRSARTRDAATAQGVESVVDSVAKVAREAGRTAERTGDVPVVLTSLPAGPQVRAEILDNAMAEIEGTQAVFVDTSTTAPADARELARELADRGCGLVDAPVSGGPTGARAGSLSVMVGGNADDIEVAEPVLNALAGRLVRCGESGAGQVAKACNQLVVVSTIGTVAESLALAVKAGADPAAVREALLGGYAASRILELHGDRMLRRDFSLGGSARNQVKDIDIIRGVSEGAGSDPAVLEIFEAAARVMEQLVADGGGDLDHSAAARVIEERLGTSITSDTPS